MIIRVHLLTGKFVQTNYGNEQALQKLRDAARDPHGELVVPDNSAFAVGCGDEWPDEDAVWANPPNDRASFIPARSVARIETL